MIRPLTLFLVVSAVSVVVGGGLACSSASNPPALGDVGSGSYGGSGGSDGADGTSAPSGSEVAVSAVSGALNNNSGTGIAWNPPVPKSTTVERALAFLSPVGTAYAATWTCTGDTLTPKFSGPGADPYSYTPDSCTISWVNGKTGSSSWSGPFTLSYGTSCDSIHALMEKQAAGCDLTRTTAAGGSTRTVTGPDGNSYAIAHDTNGAGTGWDSSVSPAPTSDGVVITCGSGGCTADRTLVINGSHLTGTVEVRGVSQNIWDHTVTASGITVTGAAADRVVNGTVTVQHNLLKYTSTTTFTSVGYGEPGCCFPTTGSVSTTFSKGAETGKTETLTFSNICGEASLTDISGATDPLTLQFCL